MTNKRRLYKNQVSGIEEIASGVFVLSFLKEYEFVAGQIVAIDIEPYGQPRLYNIASGETDTHIDILFDEKAGGKLTPWLSSLNAGDTIYVSKPFGTFRCTDRNAWWIASGTGIAPFISMLRSGMSEGKKIIHGGRFDESFYFSRLIEKEIGHDYIRCCSQQPDTRYYRGRLTNWLRDQPVLSTEISYYLCGSAEMVVEVRDILISKGIPFRQIVSEAYF